jgi:hypothetical protein
MRVGGGPSASLGHHPSAFELKSKHLRLYLLREDFTGIILTFGGRKTTQKSDLQLLQKTLLEYCQFRMKK